MWITEFKRIFRWPFLLVGVILFVSIGFLVNQELQAYQGYDDDQSQNYYESYRIAERRANIYQNWIRNQEKISREMGSDYQDQSDILNFNFWKQMTDIDRNLSYSWKEHQYNEVDQLLTQREGWIKQHFDTFVFPEKNEALMGGRKKDFLLTTKIHQYYRDHHNINYLFEGKPTLTKLWMDMFRTGIFTNLLLAYLLLIGGNAWAREFETGGYRLLFTSPQKRSTIYWARNGVILLMAIWAGLVSLALMTNQTYGNGLDTYFLIGGQMKPAIDVLVRGAIYFIGLLLTWLALINLASWFFKDRGMVYMLGVLCLGVFFFGSQLLDWTTWSSMAYGSLLVVMLCLTCLSHWLVFRQMNRRDLKE